MGAVREGGRRLRRGPTPRAGLWVCGLAAGTLVASIAGRGWIAALTALVLFAVAAAAAGTDSRQPGDWRRVDGR